MSLDHSGRGDRSELMEMFQQQQNSDYLRKFPDGRTGADDDGQTAYAIATDDKRRLIIMRFPKPTERLLALRGITT